MKTNMKQKDLKELIEEGLVKKAGESARRIYYVTRIGTVLSQHKNKLNVIEELKTPPNMYGNPIIVINENKIRLDKLVALAFVSNPKKRICVEHKDGDKMNCRADNLRWGVYDNSYPY